jgi:hypothetical protein
VLVFVRGNSGWRLEAELVPAEFLGTGRGDLGEIRIDGDTLVATYFDGSTSTALVWEREGGLWHERARIAPGGPIWSLAFRRNTLVLGLGIPLGIVLVYERSLARWIPSARLATSTGQGIGRAVAILDRQVVGATVEHFPPGENRLFFFELPPFPRLTTHGCGVNPAGSLVVLGGAPTPGANVRLGLDNPLGTQARGALALFAVSPRPDPHFPCGTLVPRTGMGRGPGELLLGGQPLVRTLGAWRGPGQPFAFDLTVPADSALIGRTFFLQGALLDLRPLARVPVGLTEALALEIGTP